MTRHVRDEHGAIGGIEGLAFGVLVFVFGTIVVVNAWAVIDTKIAASAAAREAVRAYVEASSDTAGRIAANDAGAAVLSDRRDMTISVIIENPPGSYERCAPVSAVVSVQVPRVALPSIGGRSGVTSVTARHTELVDPYRSGLGGVAECTT